MWLEIKELAVRYEGAEVVKGVSMHLEPGEIVTLIGSNGAGKSTILRALSGLKAPASGEIWFDGVRVDGRKPQSIVKMGIVQVPQDRGLFPYMTVAENLKIGAYLRKDRKATAKDLEEILKHFPRLRGTSPAAGVHAQRRRAADAGDSHSRDVQAARAPTGRAVDGAVTAHGRRDRQDHAGDQRDGHRRPRSWSRTRGWR